MSILTLFTNQIPSEEVAFSNPLEAGFRVTSSINTYIIGVRYWRASIETGMHQGTVWDDSGNILIQVNFNGETSTGWQVAYLDTPFIMTANIAYIVTVGINTALSFTTHSFDTVIINGTLSSSGDNGGYNLTKGVFPNTFGDQSCNYFVDILTDTSLLVTLSLPQSLVDYSKLNWFPNNESFSTTNAGSWITFSFNGTDAFFSLPANGNMTVRTMVDDKDPVDLIVTPSVTTIPLATGLTSGVHTVHFQVLRRNDNSQNSWSGQQSLTLDSLVLSPRTASLVSSFSLSGDVALILGDSITEGQYISSNSISGSNASAEYSSIVGRALNWNYSIVAWQGLAWLAGVSDIPKFVDSWKYHMSGVLRDITVEPKYILVNMGTNGQISSSGFNSWIADVRSMYPSSTIFMIQPFGNFDTVTQTNVVNCNDTNVHYITLGTQGSNGISESGWNGHTGTPNSLSFDNAHPNAEGAGRVASILINQLLSHVTNTSRGGFGNFAGILL